VVDRIGVRVWLDPLTAEERFGPLRGEASDVVAARIAQARERQHRRYHEQDIATNAELGPSTMHLARVGAGAQQRLEEVSRQRHLSTRGVDNLVKLARTVADLDGEEEITGEHVGSAETMLDVQLPDGWQPGKQ